MAHLIFAYTRANIQKIKRAIFLPPLDKKLLRNKRHLKNYRIFVKK